MTDWNAIRNEYINGDMSLRELCEKHGASESTVRKKAAAEHWAGTREEQKNKIRIAAEQKSQEKIADALAEEVAAKARIRGKLIQMAERWIDKHVDEDSEDTTDFRRIVQSCADMGVFEQGAETADEIVITFGNEEAEAWAR